MPPPSHANGLGILVDATIVRALLPLVKWFLAIPHYVVLIFLYVGVLFAAIGAWFAILFTGRYPRGLFT
jgi:hypothetical protein